MGLLFLESLPGPKVFKCKTKYCRVHLASPDAILASKDFGGRGGRVYVFDSVVNVSLGPKADRSLMTVNAIYCSFCQQLLGWRYKKYRGRKHIYVLKRNMMLKEKAGG